MSEMGMQEAVRSVFSKYVDFTGRARRAEYWWFALFSVVVSLILMGLQSMLFGVAFGQMGILSGLWSLATILPSIAVGVRRLHDLDKSGWWLLIALVPIIGGLLLLYWFVQRGTVGQNQYGPDPVA